MSSIGFENIVPITVIVVVGVAGLVVFSVFRKRHYKILQNKEEERLAKISELKSKAAEVSSKLEENLTLQDRLNKAISIKRREYNKLHAENSLLWTMLNESAQEKEQRLYDKTESILSILEKDKIQLKALIKELKQEKEKLEQDIAKLG